MIWAVPSDPEFSPGSFLVDSGFFRGPEFVRLFRDLRASVVARAKGGVNAGGKQRASFSSRQSLTVEGKINRAAGALKGALSTEPVAFECRDSLSS
ncbi:MAG TPA: hypothetical protein VND89_03120 [Acidimicrobiales bacterium]|nr:hypothetical protein [Acidimicrobiales bacterium]